MGTKVVFCGRHRHETKGFEMNKRRNTSHYTRPDLTFLRLQDTIVLSILKLSTEYTKHCVKHTNI